MPQQQSFDYYQLPQMPQSMSPTDLSPHSFYDTQADFSADSAPSRGSPVSPVFPASFQLPSGGDWPSAYLEKPMLSPDLDVFYGEAFGSPMSFLSSQNIALSPPADLMSDAVAFGREGVNDTQPVFQNLDTAARPQKQQQTEFSRPARAATCTPRPKPQQQQEQQPRKQAPQRTSPRSKDLKRKSSSALASSRSTSPEPPARRTRHTAETARNPHNMIEKRYRVNINEKIMALRDAVPSLRCAVQQAENPQAGGGESDDPLDAAAAVVEELGGLVPARKLNKATILSKAAEYIGHLEKKNGQLSKEIQELQKRLAEAQRWQRTRTQADSL
ncbi:hypothetical protein LX32DRAFT_656958 [Colletotrichum zoysiae]|uniref:BHLH domain-containing protein n=1 Tax=Colletotrichum zoysiae TaxID=1216348 RepID=A0AAD9H8E0_9PEZI|nr:hypothetical protein LX32DRAFT_656958 [Colletotrichum zoysiae]